MKFFDDGWADAVEDVVESITEDDATTADQVEPADLSSEEIATRYEAGLAARRGGSAEAMADLEPTFDDLDDRTNELLARIQGLLATVEDG